MIFVTFIAEIYIVGDSMVYWAEQRARFRGRVNLNLGVRIIWRGVGGLTWNKGLKGSLRQQLQWIALQRNPPSMVIVHCGGNDVIGTSAQKMGRVFNNDFRYLMSVFPKSLIVFSEILPRLYWKFSFPGSSIKKINKKCDRFNRLGREAARLSENGRVIQHEITIDTPGLFYSDGCHLSDIGCDLFNNSLQGAIESFLKSDCKVFK